MINNLFSIFDPSTFFFSRGWIILLITIFIKPMKSFKLTKSIIIALKIISTKIHNEICQLMENRKKKISSTIISKIFLTIIIINIIALFPFNFTPTAHIRITLTLSLTLWTSSLIRGWINQPHHIIIHITPIGTPTPLINFIVIIEIVRNIIRPITLSVRLSANIVAGHLLISLLSNFSLTSYTNTINSSIIIIALRILEIIVALVQAYVLVTLTTLYQNESLK